MKKTIALLFALAFAALAPAATPGSYAPATIKLVAEGTKLTYSGLTVTATPTKKTINNASIIAALQKRGDIPAGSLSGWQLFALFDEAGEYLTLVANRNSQSVFAGGVIVLDVPAGSGSGSVTFSSNGKPLSGSTQQRAGGLLKLVIGGTTYEAGVILSGSHTVAKVNKSISVMKPSPFQSLYVAGGGLNDWILTGSIATGTSTVSANLEARFPGL